MTNSIFGTSDKGDEFKEKVEIHSKTLLTVIERQKDLESSLDFLGEKLDLVDHNAISNFKKLFSELKHLRDEIQDLREDIGILKEFDEKVQKQMRLVSSKDEVSKLEKYIDLWSPMDFVTRTELDEYKDNFKKELEEVIKEFLEK